MARLKKVPLLIDADTLVWRSGYANKDPETGRPGPLSHALSNIRRSIATIIRHCEESKITNIGDVKLFMSADDGLNFRFGVDPEYKSNRKKIEKPPFYYEMKDFMADKFGAIRVSGQEADDAIGIEACKPEVYGQCVICSPDKDMRMIPGIHYEMSTIASAAFPFYIANDPGFIFKFKGPSGNWIWFGTGMRWFYFQLATGDAIDNIKRPWKFKAYEIDTIVSFINSLSKPQALLLYVESIYKSHGSNRETMIKNGRLLWIRREENEIWMPDIDSTP